MHLSEQLFVVKWKFLINIQRSTYFISIWVHPFYWTPPSLFPPSNNPHAHPQNADPRRVRPFTPTAWPRSVICPLVKSKGSGHWNLVCWFVCLALFIPRFTLFRLKSVAGVDMSTPAEKYLQMQAMLGVTDQIVCAEGAGSGRLIRFLAFNINSIWI